MCGAARSVEWLRTVSSEPVVMLGVFAESPEKQTHLPFIFLGKLQSFGPGITN